MPSAIMGSMERYVSIARSDLAAVIYDALDGRAELILDDTVGALADDGDRVRVTFESGQARDFDLVVGADGLHSRVRRLVFGPEERRSSGIWAWWSRRSRWTGTARGTSSSP